MTEQVLEFFRGQGFSLIETHISYVFLRGDDVYKVKRPVDLGFLDFTTRAARKQACEAEVALNRRLAPEVYRGVVALVTDSQESLTLVPSTAVSLGEAEPIDWAVHMHRLRDADRADVCLVEGDLAAAELAQIAGLLATFHATARADAETAQFGEAEVVGRNVEENFAQTRELARDHLCDLELTHIINYQRGFLRRHEALFRQRALDGFVRDGHGDLRLEHVYRAQGGGHVIIDCIEFNERFRFADVCADLAFLTMDLKRHGRPDLAELLAAAYAERSGDYGLYRLLDFYESYRAFVRGKVATILAHDAEVSAEARDAAYRSARGYFLLALSSAEPPLRPLRLIVSMGEIASGKSTLAQALGEKLAIPVLSADRTRKELLGVSAETPVHEPAFAGAYSVEASERVYATLRARAEHVLGSQRSVVIDATFRSAREREQMFALAGANSAQLWFVECRCPVEVARQRLRARAERPHMSDGRLEIFEKLRTTFEPTDALPKENHLVLDTSRPLDETIERALAELV